MTENKDSSRIILITGASRGIGAAAALSLATQGAHIVLCARSVEALEAVDDRIQRANGKPATLMPLDLRDHAQLDAIGPALLQKFGRLDGFVGNAGFLGQVTPLVHHDPKQFQQVMDINVTANWRLLRMLDPLLRRSSHPRVAFVTSGVTQAIIPYFGCYAMSKHALEALAQHYARETQDSAMVISLIDPGIVATDMRASAFPGEDAAQLRQPDDAALMALFTRAMSPEYTITGKRLAI